MKYDVWHLPQFFQDIASLADALSLYPDMGKRIFQEMECKIKQLEDNPYIHPVYHANTKYRRMVLEGHALFYNVDEDRHMVGIYRVIYTKRDIENMLEE